jgi:hypothetical protein
MVESSPEREGDRETERKGERGRERKKERGERNGRIKMGLECATCYKTFCYLSFPVRLLFPNKVSFYEAENILFVISTFR